MSERHRTERTTVVDGRDRVGKPLYERQNEVVAARNAVEGICAGGGDREGKQGGLLFFSAAAGLGKTTVLAEVRRIATARGCTVLSARGGEQEHTVPFHVVRQLLQPILASCTEAERREIFGGWYEIAGPAVGLFAQQTGTAAPDPQGVRDGLDWVVTQLAVRRAPIVIVLDDAHWGDLESLAWLAAFAVRAQELPVLVVLGYRPDEVPTEAATFRELIDGRSGRPIPLHVLSPEAVGELVRSSLGAEADDLFCRECWAVTGGNPYEAVELIAKVQDRSLAPNAESASLLRELAASARGAGLVKRLERLGHASVRVAWAAAVLGTEISPELAAAVAGLPPAEAQDAVDRLRVARILTGSRTLEFIHPLVATAVYQAIPPTTRTALHGQAAWAVADAGLGVTAAARHLLETHPEDDPHTVLQLRAAARENLRLGAPDAARRCLERALREPPAPEDRAGVLYELGCSALLTAPAVTVNHLTAALEQPFLDPALREDATFRLAQAFAHNDQPARAAAVAGAEAAQAKSARARLRLQAAHYLWLAFDAHEAQASERSRRLVRLAEHVPGKDIEERALLCVRTWDAMLRGEPTANTLAIAARALGLRYTDPDWGFELPSLTALSYMYADECDRAEELFSSAIAECEQVGWSGAHLSFGFTLLGLVWFRRGMLVEAEDCAREGVRLAERVGPRVPAQWYAVGLLLDVLLSRGRVEEALRVAETYDFAPPYPNAVAFPDSQTVYGRLLLARGLREEAVAQLTAAGKRLEAKGILNPTWCPWAGYLAIAIAEEDPQRARALAAEMLRRAERYGTPTAIGEALCFGAAVDEDGQALPQRERAVKVLSRSPNRHAYAEALIDLGAELRRDGRTDRVAELLFEGIELADRCGADHLAERGRAEMAKAGLRLHRQRTLAQRRVSAAEQG
ncbi:AAA family ATPase [Streptomyces sp. NBC_01241]|uniref:ATP-binding protein n=1 Tax=Streptomyces sp. NBC_01241 TaxID=2903794 RepID=UPI00352C5434|nr:AAA family ATPase [Streptomyces sp. NBC_01241]